MIAIEIALERPAVASVPELVRVRTASDSAIAASLAVLRSATIGAPILVRRTG
jgi:hypothetical protein